MRKKFCVKRFLLPFAAAGLSAVLFSCSKEDPPSVPSVKDIEGNYTGKVVMLSPGLLQENTENAPQGADVSAEVKNDTVYINNFPVDQVITSIVGEAGAAAIIEAVGQVNYKVGYTAALTAAQDSIYLQMAPKPLEINFKMPVGEGTNPVEMEVKITIEAVEKGNYAYKSNKLKFNLAATGVSVSDRPFDFDSRTFEFELDKK